MTRLLTFIGIVVGGYAGWALGERLGFDLMGAFVISTAGSAAGIYLGWRIGRDFLS